MDFEAKGPIYLQISDVVCESIMLGRWGEGARIPSVRELAMEAEVNPNTVMRTYTHLQDQSIIQNQRGIGYFVAKGAAERTRTMKREEFVSRELPKLFRTMTILGMDMEELDRHFQEYRKNGREGGEK